MKIYTSDSINEDTKKYLNGKGKIPKHIYRNILGTRKANVKFLYTSHELEECAKCYNDPIYFMEKYCKIINPVIGLNLIQLYDFQKNMINHYLQNRYTLYLNSRQAGFSTIMALLFLHEILFKIDRKIVSYSFNYDEGKEFMEKLQRAYTALPFFLQQGLTEFSSMRTEFENGSFVEIGKSNCGRSYDIVFFDQFSKLAYIDKFFSPGYALYQLNNPKIVIGSVPNGYNRFYEMIQNAERNESAYRVFKTYWWNVPGRDENWKKLMINNLGGEMAFLKEFELCFINLR